MGTIRGTQWSLIYSQKVVVGTYQIEGRATRTDAKQCFELMIKVLNDIAAEENHGDDFIVDVDPEVERLWVEAWRRMLEQIQMWNEEE